MCFNSTEMSLFSQVVQTLLNNWTALQLAVEHQLGGTQSKEIAGWMATVVEHFFKENDNVLVQEIADYMEEIMNNEFNVLCEDGSLDEIGTSLCKYYQLINEGKETEVIIELQKFKGSALHLCKKASTPEETVRDAVDKPMENLQVDSTETLSKKISKNEPDEDGWVTVSKGKRH